MHNAKETKENDLYAGSIPGSNITKLMEDFIQECQFNRGRSPDLLIPLPIDTIMKLLASITKYNLMEEASFPNVTTYINIQPGAQYQPQFHDGATNIQVQNVHTGENKDRNHRPCLDITKISAPLNTPRAMEIWQKYYDAGWIDHEFHSLRSRTESALMAKRMAEELHLNEYWEKFEHIFEMTNLRGAHGKAHDSQSGWDFDTEIDRLIPVTERITSR